VLRRFFYFIIFYFSFLFYRLVWYLRQGGKATDLQGGKAADLQGGKAADWNLTNLY